MNIGALITGIVVGCVMVWIILAARKECKAQGWKK